MAKIKKKVETPKPAVDVVPKVTKPKVYRVAEGKSITGTSKGIVDAGQLIKASDWAADGAEVLAGLVERGHVVEADE